MNASKLDPSCRSFSVAGAATGASRPQNAGKISRIRLWLHLLPGSLVFAGLGLPFARAAEPTPAQAALVRYFDTETRRIEARGIAEIKNLEEWTQRRTEYRRELFEMLGLGRQPERTDLHATVTGRISRPDFTVEKIVFQSMPGLYVTASLYLPARVEKPLPTVLYVCGHSRVVRDGVSDGNKAAYQRHGIWFARHGYVCLVVDTLQLGEIEGIHHGTNLYGMWWWNSRGYTPAGVEAWNNIRALDYLETRPEVDRSKFGVTGRSGGGAYSWVLAALDDRIQVAVPVAGVTDLRALVPEGVAAVHCDCMFYLNTYRLDFPVMVALIAPRPLLIANSDKDHGFVLESVVRLHARVREVYRWYGAEKNLGLVITEGPHRDTQELQVPAFRWFDRHLKGEEPLVRDAAEPQFSSQELRVFDALPADQINTTIQEKFVPTAGAPALPADASEWARQRQRVMAALQSKVFGGWPDAPAALDGQRVAMAVREGMRLEQWRFTSQAGVSLPFFVLARETGRPERMRLHILDDSEWPRTAAALAAGLGGVIADESGMAVKKDEAAWRQLAARAKDSESLILFPPRGIGPSNWGGDDKFRTHVRRRFMLLGQTLDGMRVWDIRRGISAARQLLAPAAKTVVLEARGEMAVNALYASLWEERVELDLDRPPSSHKIGPDYLNVLRLLDVPEALALAAEKSPVILRTPDAEGWAYPRSLAARLGWEKARWQILPDHGSNP